MWEEITAVFTIHHPHMVTKDSHLSEASFAKSGCWEQTPNCTLMDETQVNFAKENLGEKEKTDKDFRAAKIFYSLQL